MGLPAWLVALCGLMGLVGGGLWLRDPARWEGPATMILPLLVLGIAERRYMIEGVHHGKLLPTGVILVWLLSTLPWTRRRYPGSPTALAVEASFGVSAAIYLLAAVAKMTGAGGRWFDPDYLGLLILERSFGAVGPLASLRLGIAANPLLCRMLSVGALLIETGGVLLLWPRLRRPMALILSALHLGIAVTMGYIYVTWVVTLLGLAWWREPGKTHES